MLIARFKDNPFVWDKQIKDNANRQKTKEAMAPLLARFENAHPLRNLAAIKSRWHSLRSSVLRYMKKQKESFQSKVAARAPLLMAAILFFPVHEHKEFWSLSLIGSTFDSVSGTCCITVHTKFHGIIATFCPRDVPHEVQQAELCTTCSRDKMTPKLVLHK